MSVRKPTLEEWFLAQQLDRMSRGRLYVMVLLELDVTPIAEVYRKKDARVPWTAVLTKAIGLAAKEVPEANRAYARTFFGDRMIEFDHASVSLPVVVEENGKSHLSVTMVRDADTKSVEEISKTLAATKKKTVDQMKLTKLVVRKSNNFFWRTVLRILLFVLFNAPKTVAKRAAGFGLSSLINADGGGPVSWCAAPGPTGITITLSDVREAQDGGVVMRIGVAVDHMALTGFVARKYGECLAGMLSSRGPETAERFG